MLMTRIAKAIMCLPVAAFALLVAIDNLIDYGTNYEFVKHVLSMDTTFPGSRLMDRAITAPTLWAAGYYGIITGEALTGLCFLIGAVELFGALPAPAERFERAKRWVIFGALFGFLVWFLGFMVVGGEWFQMWQSAKWNGQQSAFRFYVSILAVLIFINQPDREIR